MKVQQAVGSVAMSGGSSPHPGPLRRLRRMIFRLSRIGTAAVADDVARYVVMSNYVALSAGLAAALFALLHLVYAPRAHLPITLTLLVLLAATMTAIWFNSRGRYLAAATSLVIAVPLAMLQNDWYLGNELGASQFVFACIPGVLLVIPARHRGYLVTSVCLFVLTYLASQFLFDTPQIESDPRFIRTYNLLCTLANFALLGSYYFLFYMETHRVELLREKAALEKLQQYREVVDNVLEGVFRTAQDGRTVNANPALAQLLGYDSVDQLIASVTDFRTQVLADLRERKAMQRELDRSDRVSAFEMRVRRRDGSMFLASLSVHTLRDERGQVWGYDGIMADVTVRRRHEELVRERQVAEAATQAKSEFLAKMSHELRTPMNAVIGFTDLALRTESEAKRVEHLRHIDTASRSLLHIVNDILDLSKIEAGKLVLECREFELQPLMEKLADLFAAQAAAKDLELIVPAPVGLPAVLVGDALRLEQVLVNLIGNAIKFTEQGEVELGLRAIRSDAESLHVEFWVRDTGIGLSAEQKSRLFSAFTQADSSTTRRYGGTGLGLAICKQLVELMGGLIGVDSEAGRGSRFWFELSLPVGKAQPASASAEVLRGTRVLVVDDNPVARQAYLAMLESFQFHVRTAGSGADALEWVEREAFDVVLMDWRMPNLDGLETLRRLRANPRHQRLPVLMMTAHGRDGLVQQAEQAGADACLDKPLKASTLLERLIESLRPATAEAPTRQPLDASLVPEHLRGARVLLAEDNALNRRLATEILAEAGVLVDHVENGEQAIAAVRRVEYALVLMDVQMPVLDGLEATRAIRAMPQGARLPIVAMTAAAMEGDREQCLAAGMDDFLSKPIDAAQLLGMLERKIGSGAGSAADTPTPVVARAGTADGALGLPEHLPGIEIAVALGRIGPRPRLLVELLRELARDHAHTAAMIRDELDAGRHVEAARAAHTLKGLAASLGCTELSECAREVEEAIQGARDAAEVQARCARLASAFERVRASVEQLPIPGPLTDAAERSPTPVQTDAIAELQRRIEARDFDAPRAFAAAEPALLALGDAATVQRLSGALSRFDFSSAGRLLAELQHGRTS